MVQGQARHLNLSELTSEAAPVLSLSVMPGRKVTRFHPGKVEGDGFFIAVLRKTEGKSDGHLRIRTVSQKPSAKISGLAGQMFAADSDRLIMAGNRIIALATDRNVFSYIDDRLTVIKSGTMIGETKNDSFIPAHDLAMSVKQKEGAWPVYDATYDEAVALLSVSNNSALRGCPGGGYSSVTVVYHWDS